MEWTYKKIGIITLVTILATSGGTIYFSDFKAMWESGKLFNPEQRYLVVDYIWDGQTYILMGNEESPEGFSRVRFDEEKIIVYGNGRNIDAEIYTIFEYYKTQGEDEWIRLDRQPSRVQLQIVEEENTVKVQRSTPYYATASRSQRGGVLYETFTLPVDTESSMKWDAYFACEVARCNSLNRLSYDFRNVDDEFDLWRNHTLIFGNNLQLSFMGDENKVESVNKTGFGRHRLTFEPQKGDVEVDPIVRVGSTAIDYKAVAISSSTLTEFTIELDVASNKNLTFSSQNFSAVARYAKNFQLKGLKIEELKNTTVNETYNRTKITKTGTEVVGVDLNGTKTRDVYNTTWELETVQITRQEWVSTVTIGNESSRIRVTFFREPALGKVSVDLVPKFDDIELNQFAWYNTSFPYRRTVTITELGSIQWPNNVTWFYIDSHDWTNKPYNDSVRVTDATCNAAGEDEITSQVFNTTETNGLMDGFSLALNTSQFGGLTKGGTATVCMYYDKVSKGIPTGASYTSQFTYVDATKQIENDFIRLDLDDRCMYWPSFCGGNARGHVFYKNGGSFSNFSSLGYDSYGMGQTSLANSLANIKSNSNITKGYTPLVAVFNFTLAWPNGTSYHTYIIPADTNVIVERTRAEVNSTTTKFNGVDEGWNAGFSADEPTGLTGRTARLSDGSDDSDGASFTVTAGLFMRTVISGTSGGVKRCVSYPTTPNGTNTWAYNKGQGDFTSAGTQRWGVIAVNSSEGHIQAGSKIFQSISYTPNPSSNQFCYDIWNLYENESISTSVGEEQTQNEAPNFDTANDVVPANDNYLYDKVRTWKINATDSDEDYINFYFTHNASGSNATVLINSSNTRSINSTTNESSYSLRDAGAGNIAWGWSCDDGADSCVNHSGILTIGTFDFADTIKFLDGLPQNKTVTVGTEVNFTGNTTSSVAGVPSALLPNFLIYTNDTQRASAKAPGVWYLADLGVGSYRFTFNSTGNANYSSFNNESIFLFVEQDDTRTIEILQNGLPVSREYEMNNTGNFTFISSNSGDTIEVGFFCGDTAATGTSPFKLNMTIPNRTYCNSTDGSVSKTVYAGPTNISFNGTVNRSVSFSTVNASTQNVTGSWAVDVLGDKSVDMTFDCFLKGNKCTYSYINNKTTNLLIFTSSGTKQSTMNISRLYSFSGTDIANITMNITNQSVNSAAINFQETFVNTTFVNSTTNATNPWEYEAAGHGGLNFTDRYVMSSSGSAGGSGTYQYDANSDLPGPATTSTVQGCGSSCGNHWTTQLVARDLAITNMSDIRITLRAQNPACSVRLQTYSIQIRDNSTGTDNTVLSNTNGCGGTVTDTIVVNKTGSTFSAHRNGLLTGTFTADPTKTYVLAFTNKAECTPSPHGCDEGEVTLNMQRLALGGYRAVQYSNGTFTNGTFISTPIQNFTDPIVSATLSADLVLPSGTSVRSYLSANNGTTWESVTLGSIHTFTTSGRNLTVRFDFIVSDTGLENATGTFPSKAPILRSYTVTGATGTPSNVFIDVGNDGVKEYNGTTTLTGPTRISFNASTSIRNYLTGANCRGVPSCSVPVVFGSSSAGGLNISNVSWEWTLNELHLNNTQIERWLRYNGSTYNVSFYGGNGSIDVSSFNTTQPDDHNVTIIAKLADNGNLSATTNTSTMMVRHSALTFTQAFRNLIFLAESNSSKMVTPFNQTNSTPFFNITSDARAAKFNISVRVNQTFSDTNLTAQNRSLYIGRINLTTEFQQIFSSFNLSTDSARTGGAWLWEDNENVTEGQVAQWKIIFKTCTYLDASLEKCNRSG